MSELELVVCPDAEALARIAADRLRANLTDAPGDGLLLAGGATPRRTYEVLAATAAPGELAGHHVFFTDERMVPPDHADSNYRMVRDALLAPAGLDAARVHRIPGELGAEAAARVAEADLLAALGSAPRPAVALLGLGADGHTASLFPGDPVLDEAARWFAPARAGARVSATRRLLAACRSLVFLVSGDGKAEALQALVAPAEPVSPAAEVSLAATGTVTLLVDRAAAARLGL